MANMEERLEAVVVQAESDGEKWHTIVHGDENTNVSVESGDVPTIAKQLKDIRTAITGVGCGCRSRECPGCGDYSQKFNRTN